MSKSTAISGRSSESAMIRSNRRIRSRRMVPLNCESLEGRSLLSASPFSTSLPQIAPNETIDQAYDLGGLNQPAQVLGSIGDGAEGAADVTWYQFELADSAHVNFNVSTPAGNSPFASVFSLFNSDPQDSGDPYDVDGHRLLVQSQANPSNGTIAYSQDLGPGDYFVAVSGAGNLNFSPVIAGSGYEGATGIYDLSIAATDLSLSGAGPTVLSSDPAPGAILASSPLAVRLEMSGPIDPNTIVAGQTVQLFFSPIGATGGVASTPVALASVNFSSAADELQLFPVAALAPGNYLVKLAGDSSTGQAVLANFDSVPLGEDGTHPSGADASLSFEVNGIDGVVGATASDDTPATAQQLGNVAGSGLIQINGAIGDDPSFDPSLSPDPTNPEPAFIPANQVNFYHFQISGPGRYALLSEVFAGRIGSPLDPGVSLWKLDPSNGSLVFIEGNDNTLNTTGGTDGSVPLLTDSALTAGLTAGDYYLAVADGSNTPSPLEGQAPGTPGILDPNQPGSAQLGWSTGSYVLNLLVEPVANPPQVLASSPSSGQVLDQSPTQLTVQFSGPINLQQLAYQTYKTSGQSTLSQVYIEGSDGTKYYPRFLSYDRVSNQAMFQMLDGLINGQYTLHLSGPGGLTDLAGNPLVSNDPSGDDVIPFQVEGPDLGISGDRTDGYTVLSKAGQGNPQTLGVLFPDALQASVTVIRGPMSTPSPTSPSTADEYVIQLLQNQEYSFTLSGNDLSEGVQVTVTDALGHDVPLLASNSGLVFFAPIEAGTYTITVGGWNASQSASVSYRLTIHLVGQQDNASPLVDGPSPALQLRLNALPGPGAASPPALSNSPAPSGNAGGTGGTDPAVSSTPPTPFVPSAPSTPSTPSDPSVPSAPPTPFVPSSPSTPPTPSDPSTPSFVLGPQPDSDVAEHSGSTSFSGPSYGLTASGMVALSVTPVGSLHGNAESSVSTLAQVAFSIPSHPSSLPSTGQAFVRLMTGIHFPGFDDAPDPDGSLERVAGGEASDPAVVFDEALNREATRLPVLIARRPRVILSGPTLDESPVEEQQAIEAAAASPVAGTVFTGKPAEGAQEPDAPGGRIQLASMAWGAAIAAVVSIPIAMIRRHRASRRIAFASSAPVLSVKFAEETAPTRIWIREKSSVQMPRSRIGQDVSKKSMVVGMRVHI
jgi:methionine-rich copper-binding protein CopC